MPQTSAPSTPPNGAWNTATFTKPDITVAGASGAWTTGNSPITLFTVTGLVLCRVFGVVTNALKSTANLGTLSIGGVSVATVYIGTTTINGTALGTGTVWASTTPVAGAATQGLPNATPLFLSNSDGISVTILTDSMSQGGIVMYCEWIPVTTGATVVAVTP